jgi:hypothetical protein
VRLTAARRSPVENFRCLAAEGYQPASGAAEMSMYPSSSPALLH